MLKRANSRPRARLHRPSPTPTRKNQWTGHIFVVLGGLLLLASVVLLQAKLGSVGLRHSSHDEHSFAGRHRARARAIPSAGLRTGSKEPELLGKKPAERAKLLEDSETFERQKTESFGPAHDGISRTSSKGTPENISVTTREVDGIYSDDDEEKAEDVEADMDMENEEMEDLDNEGINLGDGLDDMDEDEEDEFGERTEELEEPPHKTTKGKTGEGAERQQGKDAQDAKELADGSVKSVDFLRTRDEVADTVVKRDGDKDDKEENAGGKEEDDVEKKIVAEGGNAKFLQRLGHIKSVPRWDWSGKPTGARASAGIPVSGSMLKINTTEKSNIVWDHLLGVARKAGKSTKNPNSSLPRKVSLGLEGRRFKWLMDPAEERISASRNETSLGLVEEAKQVFTTDDELLDDNIQERLEEVTAIEDALLLKTDKVPARKGVLASWIDNLAKKSAKGDSRRDKFGKVPYDPLNPVNNPLLQDPDTFGPSGLTRSDKAILKVLRKASIENTTYLQDRPSNSDNLTHANLKGEAQSERNAVGTEPTSGTNSSKRAARENSLKSFLNEIEQNEGETNRTVDGNPRAGKILQGETTDAAGMNEQHPQESEMVAGRRRLNQDMANETFSHETAASQNHGYVVEELATHLKDTVSQNEDSLVDISHSMESLKMTERRSPILQDVVRNLDINMRSNPNRVGRAVIEEVLDWPQNFMSQSLGGGQSRLNRGKGHRLGGRKRRVETGSNKLLRRPPGLSGDRRRWGYFPGMHPFLYFSEFLEQFLDDSKCSLRVFMAWTTPPWSYTVRYQRSLESLLHFHPKSCVVIFSESMELDFFQSFVEDGYRVAVVMPNLEELLENTPTEVFADRWLSWRKIDLYYIHYTELLRLAALYKYGGLYLDTDVIVLRPISSLHNSVGTEYDNKGSSLNGAFMAFDKYSPFLMECLAEFTATYDDQSLDWNGAGLVARVAKRSARNGDKKRREHFGDLNIEPPLSFFPLSAKNITRYFAAPDSEDEKISQERVLQIILNQSYALHFWNRLTSRLVPEAGSLVEKVLNQYCLRCHEYF